MAWNTITSVSEIADEEINVGFSREDERSARASRRAMKKSRKVKRASWDDEEDGWN